VIQIKKKRKILEKIINFAIFTSQQTSHETEVHIKQRRTKSFWDGNIRGHVLVVVVKVFFFNVLSILEDMDKQKFSGALHHNFKVLLSGCHGSVSRKKFEKYLWEIVNKKINTF